MGRLDSAGIHCWLCPCVRTYTGSTHVGSSLCNECGHELRDHQVDVQAGFALDSTGRMPEGFSFGAHFE